MKINSIVALAFALLTAEASFAQAVSTTAPAGTTTTAEAPKSNDSSFTFAPQLSGGMHSVMQGQMSGGTDNRQVGPYIAPAVDINYKAPKFKINLNYELEMGGMATFTNEKGVNKNFADNSYFQHHPIITASGGLSDNWKLNAVADISFMQQNGDQGGNSMDVDFLPEIERIITPTFSVAAGYWLMRSEQYDGNIDVVTERTSETGEKFALNLSSEKFAESFNAANPNLGLSPVDTLNAGFVKGTVKLGKVTSKTYVRAGRGFKIDKDTYSYYNYRINTDLIIPIEKLTLSLRYRFQVKDPINPDASGSTDLSYLNRGRLIAEYEINDNWGATLQNTFDAMNKSNDSPYKYLNEGYLGAIYKF